MAIIEPKEVPEPFTGSAGVGLSELVSRRAETEGPGLAESTILSFDLSLIGQVANQGLPRLVDSVLFSEEEEGWDPYAFLGANPDEYFAQRPWMVRPFMDGTVDSIPNSARFERFEDRQRRDWEQRQRLGQAGLVNQIAGGVIGSLPDAVTFGLVGRAAAGASRAAGLAESATGARLARMAEYSQDWMVKGGNFERVAKIALASGVGNLAYDQAVRAANPNRNVEDERLQAVEQFAMGAFFGAAAGSILAGTGKLGQWVQQAQIDEIRGRVAETISGPEPKDIPTAIADDLAEAERLMAEDFSSATVAIKAPPGLNLDAAAFQTTAGTVPVRRQFTLLRDPNDPAPFDDFVRRAEQRYGKDNVIFIEHPQQFMVDHLSEIDQIRSVELGRIGGAAVSALRTINASARAMEASPSLLARKAARMFFDFTLPTKEGADPFNSVTNPPAESLANNYHKFRDDTLGTFHDQLATASKNRAVYQFADGRQVQFRRRSLDREVFGEAVMDHLRQLDRHRRGWQAAPQAPKEVQEAARAFEAYYRQMGQDLVDVGLMDQATLANNYGYFGSRRYNAGKIRENRERFRELLVREQQKYHYRSYKGAKTLTPADRKVIGDVVQFGRASRFKRKDAAGRQVELGLDATDRATLQAWADQKGVKLEDVTEADVRNDLGSDLLDRYQEEVMLWHERRAESMIQSILDETAGHGVHNGITGAQSLWERSVYLDDIDAAEFLDNNVRAVLEAYDHVMAGKLAVRRVVKQEEVLFDPIVRKLTGKTLAQQSYDPTLVLQAVQDHFQQWTDAYKRAGHEAAAAKNATAMQRTLDVMTKKLDELQGRPVFGGNEGKSVIWNFSRFAGRQAFKFPFMSFMGKMAIGNLTDIAALSLYKGMTPQRLSVTLEAINFFREVPERRHLEGLFVATSDIARAQRAVDIGEAMNFSSVDEPFGPGRAGQLMAGVDRATDKLADAFVTATGIRRVTTNLKRAAATLIQREIIEGARKLVDAQDLMKSGGKTRSEALAAVGLSEADAARLGRLGMNVDRSRRLMDLLDQYAVDWEGNRVNSRHKGWISPEAAKWYNKDRDLWESLTHAINSETLNLIVEPKLLSKPLMNQTWLGRAVNQFQSFAFAWGNQLAPMLAMRPKTEALAYATLSVGFGVLADAVYNQLSGRRTLADSASQMQENPVGMLYAGIHRSPLLGWLSRPIGLLEQTPLGPGRALGNQSLSTMSARPELTAGDVLGPVFGWSDSLLRASTGFGLDGYTDSRARRLFRALPFSNWYVLDAFNRSAEAMGFDTPIGPSPPPRLR